jgi:flagellar motor switch/type III secretory pathway protein FliN
MTAARIQTFPWQRVPRIERRAVARRRELLLALDAAFDPARALQALEQLLGIDAKAELALELAAATAGAPLGDSWLTLRVPAQGLRLDVRPEPELVRFAVARLLAQDFELGWADAGIEPPLAGAGAALLLEVARRAAESEAPELTLPPGLGEPQPAEPHLAGRLTLWLQGKPYRADVVVHATGASLPERTRRARIECLGEARVAVPWVCAVSCIEASALTALRAGDIWVAGAGAWLAGEASPGAGVLAAPRADRGLPVRVSSGRIVLGASVVRMPEELESTMSHQESELEQIVGDTPLVVRLEVGALEMTAAEWAALRPGDVVQSGRRLEDPVILRAGGREIARGELVDIEGEVGVRITHVVAARVSP